MKVSYANINIEISEPVSEQDIINTKNILDYLFNLNNSSKEIKDNPELTPIIRESEFNTRGREFINIDNEIEFITNNDGLIKLRIINELNTVCLKIEEVEELSKKSEEERAGIFNTFSYQKRRVLRKSLDLWYKIEGISKETKKIKTRKEQISELLNQGKSKEDISRELNLNLDVVNKYIESLNSKIPFPSNEKTREKVDMKIHMGL